MSKKDWLEKRKQGLGGSDAAPALGLSPWKTPYQLYLEKRGEIEGQGDNERMFWGRTLEQPIRQHYSDLTGRTVIVPSELLVSPKYPFMIANPDGIADGRVVEVKTAGSDTGWGDPGTDEIPDHYALQCQHYMIVTELPVTDVAVLIRGSDFRIYEVPEDRELQEIIIEREALFWDMVQAGQPPQATTYDDLKLRFGSMSKAITVQADNEAIVAVSRLKQLKEIAKEEEALKAVIMGILGEADTLMYGDQVLATWKATKSGERFDQKAFQKAHPELYKEFMVATQPTRRLLVK